MSVKCPKCQFDNPDTQKFCGECGTKLQPAKGISLTETLKTPKPDKTIVGKYHLLEKLGKGGMGIVYKAKDTKLDRTVALKFLPPELTRDEEAKKRFIQEAKTASALDHQNVCTIFEIDETEDKQMFISMACYEGESLKEKIEKGPLDIEEAVSITTQIAQGLDKAHKKGIIHRDIKPANIMITEDNVAKIVDFGLAKLAGQVGLSRPDTILGTVAYMSPEQAQGETVDHRSDIWSLGVVLYEMLSGQRPFKGERMEGTIHSILNKEQQLITSLRSEIPGHILKVLNKALEKDASKRYQNTQELVQDLKQSPPITFSKAEKSIVVLPFENLSPDSEQEYFCDGMTEEIISDLSKVKVLKIISRSSAMTFKGTKKKIDEIAKDVNVQYVLEGSVRKAGNNLRITAQLIDATNDSHIWAEKYSGTLDDVFDIQERVSQSIVNELKLKLSPEEKKCMAERPIGNIQIYECYMRARQEIYRLSEESLDRALQILQNGLDIFGDDANLYAGMAQAHFWKYEMFYTQDESALKKAKEYAKKAVALNPNSSVGYSLLGHYERVAGDSKEACKYMNKAVSIDPNNADILLHSVWMNALYVGKPEIAGPLADRLLGIDPLTPLNYYGASLVPWSEGRFDRMEELCTSWYKMAPDSPLAALWYAWSLAWNKKYNEAIAFINETIHQVSHPVEIDYMNFLKYSLQGEKSRSLESLTDQSKDLVWNDPGEGIWLTADIYSLLDEKELALIWMERLIEQGWINYPLLSEIDPFLENIRGEPRFKELMKQVKHEWENFEA